jgi:hypothetical protein
MKVLASREIIQLFAEFRKVTGRTWLFYQWLYFTATNNMVMYA